MRVSAQAWAGLSAGEKASIQLRHVIETTGPGAFGTIIDSQAVDRSTPRTSGGAALGSLVGGAAYIDHAFRGNNNYSALGQLGVALLGVAIGSSLDRPAQAMFQFRYAVRLGDDSVVYQDAFSSDPFRMPVGICVAMPGVITLVEQHLCTESTESLRVAYLPPNASPLLPAVAVAPGAAPAGEHRHATLGRLVTCRLTNLAPVRTTADKCALVSGVISE